MIKIKRIVIPFGSENYREFQKLLKAFEEIDKRPRDPIMNIWMTKMDYTNFQNRHPLLDEFETRTLNKPVNPNYYTNDPKENLSQSENG